VTRHYEQQEIESGARIRVGAASDFDLPKHKQEAAGTRRGAVPRQ
jgi:hypothetical protein